MIKKTYFLSLALVASLMCAKAQVTIGSQDDPDADAVLDLQVANKGLLLPRVTLTHTTDAAPLKAHVAGMVVYNTATAGDVRPGMYYNDGSKWRLARGGTVINTVEVDGMFFMERNLGADPDADPMPITYNPGTNTAPTGNLNGDYYQWGRIADGHQRWNSPTMAGPTDVDDGNGQIPSSSTDYYRKFITTSDSPHDWKATSDNTLWADDGGKANPCPEGYRIPTQAEWQKVVDATPIWNNDIKGVTVGMNFFLPATGLRNVNGAFNAVGMSGNYWSATISGTYAYYLYFNSANSGMLSLFRSNGLSVRCLEK